MTETKDDPTGLRNLVAFQKGMTLLAENTEIRPAALSYVKPSEYRKQAEAVMDAMLGCIAARDAELATLRAQLAGVREKVEQLDRWDLGGYCDGESGCCGESVECVPDGDYLDRAAVLAILGGAP